MTRYLLAVHGDGSDPYPPSERQAIYDEVEEFNDQLKADGSWVFGAGLEPVEMSTVVDATSGNVLMTDGPYVEAKEHIAGFWIIEAADLDAAWAIAAGASRACRGAVEVRPFDE